MDDFTQILTCSDKTARFPFVSATQGKEKDFSNSLLIISSI
jgi:hypothetical protein